MDRFGKHWRTGTRSGRPGNEACRRHSGPGRWAGPMPPRLALALPPARAGCRDCTYGTGRLRDPPTLCRPRADQITALHPQAWMCGCSDGFRALTG